MSLGLDEKDRGQLIDELRRLPLEKVPKGMSRDIMKRLEEKEQPSLLVRLGNLMWMPATISFRPLYAMCLLCMVSLAFWAGRNSVAPPEIAVNVKEEVQGQEVTTAQAAYFMGRALLESGKSEKALGLLQKAALLEPDNPEYAYWEGVGFWQCGLPGEERNSYLRGLEAYPESIPLLVNLAHNYLNQKEYEKALSVYRAVLAQSPGEPAALYNVGLISRKLGRVEDETAAWRGYLGAVRVGKFAYRAVQRLNSAGDYRYRQFQVGVRKLIVDTDILLGKAYGNGTPEDELESVAAILDGDKRLYLDIVVFVDGDEALAQRRAVGIKRTLVNMIGRESAERIKISWFGESEVVAESGGTVRLDEGVLLFSSIPKDVKKEV